MFRTLIDSTTLSQHLGNAGWLVIDSRFDLTAPEKGAQEYLDAHIPGAVYAHLDHDLSGPPMTNRGRHPMPTAEALTATFSRLGIDGDRQVVAYDGAGGSISARLWWLLRHMGHGAVAVLDGGWPAWKEAGLPVECGPEINAAAVFSGQARTAWVVRIDEVPDVRYLVDSRDPARYRGEHEPIDRAAGHIPDAVNYFWKNNLDASMRFLGSDQLRGKLLGLLRETAPGDVVFYCGSGVTACHNLLAMEHAGLRGARLYAGSWSEWCSDPSRPVAVGDR